MSFEDGVAWARQNSGQLTSEQKYAGDRDRLAHSDASRRGKLFGLFKKAAGGDAHAKAEYLAALTAAKPTVRLHRPLPRLS